MSLVVFRDLRQRQYLGPRYDCRQNAYDWDYHMKLVNKEVNNSINTSHITYNREYNIPCIISHTVYNRVYNNTLSATENTTHTAIHHTLLTIEKTTHTDNNRECNIH